MIDISLVDHSEYLHGLEKRKNQFLRDGNIVLIYSELRYKLDLYFHIILIPDLKELYICPNPAISISFEKRLKDIDIVHFRNYFGNPKYGMIFHTPRVKIERLKKFLDKYNYLDPSLMEALEDADIKRTVIEELIKKNKSELEKMTPDEVEREYSKSEKTFKIFIPKKDEHKR